MGYHNTNNQKPTNGIGLKSPDEIEVVAKTI
jgi:hypothetical protein